MHKRIREFTRHFIKKISRFEHLSVRVGRKLHRRPSIGNIEYRTQYTSSNYNSRSQRPSIYHCVYIYTYIHIFDTRNFQQHRAIRGLLLTAFIINGTTVQYVVPPFKYPPNFLHSAVVDLPQNKEKGRERKMKRGGKGRWWWWW